MADRGSFLTGLRRAGKLAGCAPHGSAVNERREYMSEPANQTIRDMIERRSCRSFRPDMVPHETIEKIIEAGLYAASGRGMQSPIIVAVTERTLRDRLSESNRKIGGWPFYGAPVVLIVLADKTRPTAVYDGSLVMGNLMVAAQSLGVASCWIHRAKEEFETEEYRALLKSLGVEGDYEGIGHCVLGYPAKPLGGVSSEVPAIPAS